MGYVSNSRSIKSRYKPRNAIILMQHAKHIFIMTWFLFIAGIAPAFGQLKFHVASFGEDQFDLAARDERFKKIDGSGSLYAIIKVSGDDLKEYMFDFGNMNHLVEEHEDQLWVYVQKNAKQVTISRNGYTSLRNYDFRTTIESGKTYRMQLSAQEALVQHSILLFNVEPANANAIIKVKREGDSGDYQLWGMVDASGGLARRLEVGTYLYEITSEFYDRTEGRVTLNGAETKHVEKVALTPNFGLLSVTDPGGLSGAEIYVDNRKIGTVPYTSSERWPVRDNYSIMVNKGELYKTYSSTFNIRKGETTKIVPQLQADFAQITLTVANNAEIWIENEQKGMGTWTGPLRSGVYQVECRLDSHRTTSRTISVAANQAENIQLDAPVPITGSLFVNTTPIGVSIKVDATDYGTSPDEIRNLLIGQYIVTLTLDGYNTETRSIEVKENETAELSVNMTKGTTNAMPSIGGRPSASGGRTFTVNGVSFTMMPVEGGIFRMGATEEQGSDVGNDENPVHKVTLNSYYIGQTEVTQKLWNAVMSSSEVDFQGDNLPIVFISRDDCQTFINRLNQFTGQKFRLPTEAEWEYAARGGNHSKGYKYSGSNTLSDVAWYEENSDGKTHPVATKRPNELGLYDMSGNVWEWCKDWYDSYRNLAQSNPTGSYYGSFRVLRGGSWRSSTKDCRVSCRNGNKPSFRSNDLGFRLVLSE